MRSPIRRFVPVVAAGALAVGLTACSGSGSAPSTDHGSAGMPGMSTSGTTAPGSAGTAPADVGRSGDIMFAQMMIPHHQQAVEMAEIAIGKPTASAQVRQLATQIKAGQDPEVQTMGKWLRAWGAPTPTGGTSHGMSGEGMMTQADMDALKATDGDAFDKQWVRMMTAHHEGAITMAKQVLVTTQDPAVRTLAEAVVKAQTEEIATMKSLF